MGPDVGGRKAAWENHGWMDRVVRCAGFLIACGSFFIGWCHKKAPLMFTLIVGQDLNTKIIAAAGHWRTSVGVIITQGLCKL